MNLPIQHTSIKNFNPIIGLILTDLRKYGDKLLYKFQSHYRSDFNFNKGLSSEKSLEISIPL